MKLNKLFNSLLWSSIAMLSISSCTDYNTFTEGELKHLDDLKKYTDAFEATFGKPDPNHDWGMNEEIGAIGGLSSIGTRAGTPDPNRNMWAMYSEWIDDANGNKVPKYNDNALAHDIQIPGWPHLNGLYYASTGPGAYNEEWVLQSPYQTVRKDTKHQLGTDGVGSYRPIGDVTPYEIQYVSAWFRSHKAGDPEFDNAQVSLHLSDFFIQNVCCDADQEKYDPITSADKTGYNGANIINQDTEFIKHTNGSTENIGWSLDELEFKDVNNEWTHVYNFNHMNSNWNPEESSENPNREIIYIKSSGTEDFRCHPSFNTQESSYWLDNEGAKKHWVLVRLTWTETVKNPKSPRLNESIPREGYYLAFDFEAHKGGVDVNCDGYFSNWIVKITPAYFNPTGKTRRIFCEDLGGTWDFDFNDAVVDVAFQEVGGQYQSIISVQAAGGTMPIYVEHDKDVKNGFYEIHKLLDKDVKTPVNAIPKAKGGKSHAPAIYRGGTYSTSKAGNIKLKVYNTQNGESYELTDNYPDDDDNDRTESLKDPYGSTYDKAGVITPRAFATPTHVKWTQELEPIHETYTKFPTWVANATQEKTWYNTTATAAKLYNIEVELQEGSPTGESTIPDTWVGLTPQTPTVGCADYMLTLGGYDGDDAIWKELDKETNPASQMTFNIVFKSTVKQDIEAILIPANVVEEADNTKLYYQGNEPFMTFTNATDFATQMQNVIKTFGNAIEQTDMCTESNYIYNYRITFTKSQLVSTAPGAENGYCKYLLLYIKASDKSKVSIPAIPDAKNSQVEWYIHY